MRLVYDPRHAGHRPRTEILYGKPTEHPERPERVEAVRAALERTPWGRLIGGPRDIPLAEATRVHEAAYLAHLEERCAEAGAEGPTAEWFPYVWPRDRALDTGTPLLGPTLTLAWGAACVALTGAELLLEGAAHVYALCRPPGHHAAAGASGGYCYFNNAALATERLHRAAGAAGRNDRIAILDLDIHHGNGTQEIFYRSDRVLYCSIHGEPAWAYPPHTGFPEETGAGAGHGFTFNQVLPQGTTWPTYAAALDRALERIGTFHPSALVLSQGFDILEGDRWGGFLLRPEHCATIGERLRALRLPVLIVLEGGYEPATIAAGSIALLQGIAPMPPGERG
jgi:acetoin utilization deacetylase AcuC-like enzyme